MYWYTHLWRLYGNLWQNDIRLMRQLKRNLQKLRTEKYDAIITNLSKNHKTL